MLCARPLFAVTSAALRRIAEQKNSRPQHGSLAIWIFCPIPILGRIRAALDKTYGANVERAVLFGSRARADARPDSDYDIAVFLKEPDSFWRESGRLAEIETDILYDTGAVINALPLKAGRHREPSAFMEELTRDGRDL